VLGIIYLTTVREIGKGEIMEEKLATKDRIEQIALELFAKKGYQSVSIRDIGKLVGIKESSIYYHFKNKQAIMDSLLDKIDLLVEKMKADFEFAFIRAEEITEEAMSEVAVGFLKGYLLNPYVYQMLAFLVMEQMMDPKAYETYQRLVFDLPLSQQEKVFDEMMKRGFIKQNNPAILAQEYYAVIFLAFQKNCVGCLTTDEKIEMACEEICSNIKDIYQKMKGCHDEAISK
jgi:AcrR family transcriptional regulator